MKFAIITVGYNRPHELMRLIDSVCNASYSSACDLIISLDFCEMQKTIVDYCDSVEWKYGQKIIRAFKSRQGLRNHIIQCGDLTAKYDAVIVLEDDLVVSKSFFEYAKRCVEFYDDDQLIAGISLYTHRTNPGNGRFFEAQYNGYDAFLMQYAQSWGQCWTRKMWNRFKEWYNCQQEINDSDFLPNYITNWNAQSWLKYYIKYTVEKGLYFVYPYFSLTTNSTSVGEHNKKTNSAYQVPMIYGDVYDFRLPSVQNAVKYDVYFERIIDENSFIILDDNVIIDLYGLKTRFANAAILYSTQKLNYRIIKEIALQYRPHEVNLMMPEEGKGIFVYDLKSQAKNNSKNELNIAKYDFRAQSSKLTMIHGLNGLKTKFLGRLKFKLK